MFSAVTDTAARRVPMASSPLISHHSFPRQSPSSPPPEAPTFISPASKILSHSSPLICPIHAFYLPCISPQIPADRLAATEFTMRYRMG